jgi:hypothetical protein
MKFIYFICFQFPGYNPVVIETCAAYSEVGL